MKLRTIIFIILLIISVNIVFNKNYKKTINILSITSLPSYNYNNDLSEIYSNNKHYNFNIDFSNEHMEIENLIGKIYNNTNNIKNIIHKSDVIILSIGNNDYKTEELANILKELTQLFKEIRKINHKKIIFISPYNIKSITQMKEVCNKYNILFINGSSYINNLNKLSQYLVKIINNTWNKEKY